MRGRKEEGSERLSSILTEKESDGQQRHINRL